jgi:hypothetical protein
MYIGLVTTFRMYLAHQWTVLIKQGSVQRCSLWVRLQLKCWIYFTKIWHILFENLAYFVRKFGIFCSKIFDIFFENLAYFMAIWYVGMLSSTYQGNILATLIFFIDIIFGVIFPIIEPLWQVRLPDSIFSNQKSQFGYILKGRGIKKVGIFYGYLAYFAVIWYVFPHFSMLYQEKSDNPAR